MSVVDRLTAAAHALVTTQRADAISTTGGATAASGATVANVLSGIGGARDSGATARPNLAREYLSDEELIALLRGSVYRRIIELKPRWATSRGWVVTDDTDDDRPLGEALKRLRLKQAFRAADTWGRALGEARLLLVTDDPDPLDEPLDPRRVRKLHRVEVLDRREFTPVRFNSDPRIGPLGEPELYRLHPWRTGVVATNTPVHASRLLRFYGDELPPSERGMTWPHWGADAVGQTLWDGIRHLAQTGSGGARLAQELSVAVFKLQAQAGAAGDQRESILAKMRALNLMKSIANAVWLNTSESFERVAANPSGFKDLSEHARLELALLTGYPLTLLFGIAPGGLNTDGESWQVAWGADVAAHQDERYRPPLETIVEVLYWSERGGVPDEWDIEFRPLGELTDKEKAEIRLLHTEADSVAIVDGVLTVEEVRGRYRQPGGYAFDLQPVEERLERPGGLGTVDPAIEESARRMIEGALGSPDAPDAPDEAEMRGDAVDPGAGVCVLITAADPRLTVPVLLEQPDDPHVTVLYVGKDLDEAAVAEVVEVVREVAADAETCALEHGRVVTFPGGADGIPVVVEFDAWPLQHVHERLLRRLAHVVTARQHARFRPHLTLGYARELSTEQRTALLEVDASAVRIPVVAIEVRQGREIVATVPLGG